MNRIVRATIVVAFLAAAAASANAQQQAPGPRRDRPSEEQREAVRKKVDAVRIVRLTETLRLDEKTAAAFIPVITALEQKRRELLKENRIVMEEMRLLLQASPPDEGKLKAAISRIEKNRLEISAQRNKEFEAARSHLTITQTARYIIFNQEFQQEMRGMMDSAQHGRGGREPVGRRPGPGAGGGPPESR